MKVISIDKDICTGCQECTKVCPVNAIEGEHGRPQTINEKRCIRCGQCVQKCKAYISPALDGVEAYKAKRKERCLPDTVKEPLFAAYNESHIKEVIDALNNPSKICVVHAAPAVRVALGEEFGIEEGSIEDKRMNSALYALGFDHVYDANFAADLTSYCINLKLINRLTCK